MGRSTLLNLLATALSATTAHAHYGYDWQGDEGGGSSCPPWAYDCDGSDNGESSGSGSDGSSSNGIAQGVFFSDSAQFNKATRILIAHAAMASLVWVLFVPSMAILLRPNIKSPIILKLHAVGQILSYIIYIVAAGMGIWLARQVDTYTSGGVWNDPHPKLGLAILALAFFQPILGAIHHSIYKKRARTVDSDKPTKPPGRTAPGHAHVWLGRLLIVLGIINGGLGIRLASFSPFQTDSTSKLVKIVYGVIAASMFLLYLLFVVLSQIRRSSNRVQEVSRQVDVVPHKDGLPTYDESEESVSRSSRSSPTARAV